MNQFVIPDWCYSALEGMENYTKLGKLGEGTYGVVYKVNEEACANIIVDPFSGDGQSDEAECGIEADSFGNGK